MFEKFFIIFSILNNKNNSLNKFNLFFGITTGSLLTGTVLIINNKKVHYKKNNLIENKNLNKNSANNDKVPFENENPIEDKNLNENLPKNKENNNNGIPFEKKNPIEDKNLNKNFFENKKNYNDNNKVSCEKNNSIEDKIFNENFTSNKELNYYNNKFEEIKLKYSGEANFQSSLNKEDRNFLIHTYNFLENQLIRSLKSINNLSEDSQIIKNNIIESYLLEYNHIDDLKALINEISFEKDIEIIFNNSFEKKNFLDNLKKSQEEINKYIKYSINIQFINRYCISDVFLMVKIKFYFNKKELLNNKNFIAYIKEKESLKEYRLDNNFHNFNCYLFSLMHMISVYIFKIKKNKNFNKKEKETILSELLYEFNVVNKSLKDFLKKYHENIETVQEQLVERDLNKFIIKYSIDNLEQNKTNRNDFQINLDEKNNFNKESIEKITYILTEFFYSIMGVFRGNLNKKYGSLNGFLHNGNISLLFEIAYINLNRGRKDLKFLLRISNNQLPFGIMGSIKENNDINHFNGLLANHYFVNCNHFICKVWMTPVEYGEYKDFLNELQIEINKIDKNQFKEIVPYNSINKNFLSPLILTDKIP